MKQAMFPLISVIVPIYNVEKYVAECLESICNQTYKNLEIIVVNDGSIDAGKNLVLEWKKKDDRIILIDQDHNGISVARNAGIERAQGEYIAFVDADDFIDQNMYLHLYHLIEKTKCKVAMCCFNLVSNDGKLIEDATKDPKSQIYFTEDFLWAIQDNYRNYANFVCAWNKLYKADIFDGIRYPEGKVHEDNWIIHKVIYKARKIAYTDERLYFYRRRYDSIMGSNFSMERFDNFDAQVDRIEYLDEKHANPKLIERMGKECAKVGISYWLEMKYYKSAVAEEEAYYRKVKAVVQRFGDNCSGKNKIKCVLFLKMPKLFYKIFEINKKRKRQ